MEESGTRGGIVCTRVQGTRGCVFRGCVDRLARLPAIGPNSVCISLWWQLEVSRVRTRWLRGSLVSRRHLSSCCSLEATANPLSSSSFSFCLYPHLLLLLLLQPCRNPSQGNHASKKREGRRSGKSIGAFWRYANAAGYPWVEPDCATVIAICWSIAVMGIYTGWMRLGDGGVRSIILIRSRRWCG